MMRLVKGVRAAGLAGPGTGKVPGHWRGHATRDEQCPGKLPDPGGHHPGARAAVGALLRLSQGHGLSHRIAVPWLLAASSLLLAEHSQSS
jgi:hypothetical protein